MSLNKTYAVFGLGRYGYSVAKELVNCGADVIAIDSREQIVNTLANELPFCKCADTTDIEVLKRLGISTVDTVIVAMAGSIEASVMTVMLCKELGVPTVIAKCSSEMHYKILTKVGADKVVFPEKESGVRLAKNLLSSGFEYPIFISDDDTIVTDMFENLCNISLDIDRFNIIHKTFYKRYPSIEIAVILPFDFRAEESFIRKLDKLLSDYLNGYKVLTPSLLRLKSFQEQILKHILKIISEHDKTKSEQTEQAEI